MRLSLALSALLMTACSLLQAQTLVNLTHRAPDGAEVAFQMTDGTVIVQGFQGQDFWKLTPDINGSYVNGTWTQLASLAANYDPYAEASAVLGDGRLLIEGGEYNFGSFSFTNLGAVYDPATNVWTPLTPPPGWDYIGDSQSLVLPNGHYLIGRKFDTQIAELDPATMTWTARGSSGKADWHSEESWTLMPNGTILTVDVLNHPHAEHYIPSEERWVSDGDTPVDLQGPPEVGCIQYGGGEYCPPGEIGPAILRPDGTVLETGALHQGARAGHTAIYHPPANPEDSGTWTAGPDFLNGDQAGDDFAVLLPNGKVLVESDNGRFYEFDGTNLTPTLSSFGGSLMVLPTGEVLVGGEQVYRPSSNGLQIWAPVVTICPTDVTRGQSYSVFGRAFSGWSQAASFGDEFETATNYPLVRIKNNATGHIFYAKTHGHSTMGVQTRNVPTFTHFDVPAGMETGASTLYVVTNGLASNPVSIMVH